MLVLAIDTALEACAAAVLDTERAALLAHEQQFMARGHAEALMPLVERVIVAADVGFAALDRIAVTTGPGSFTGLRVGISAARGLGLAADKPVLGLTTLSAFAAPIVAEARQHPVISAIDARHDHVYLQVVEGNGTMLQKPHLASIADAVKAAPSVPILVGNAAHLLAERWPDDAPAPLRIDRQVAPDIGWVAWLGAAADPARASARPFYLRAVDVKTATPVPREPPPPNP